MPGLPDRVTRDAYSHEVSSAGFWPGGPGAEAFFYSYAYPEPKGYREYKVMPAEARFDATFGEFILPYEAMRKSADPDGTLLEFLQSTYEAAANLAKWDRAALEVPAGSDFAKVFGDRPQLPAPPKERRADAADLRTQLKAMKSALPASK